MKERESGGSAKLCSFVIEVTDVNLIGDKRISHNASIVSCLTSGGYAHGAARAVAQRYVPKKIANDENGWSIKNLGGNLAAKYHRFSLIDSNSRRMRS